MATATRERVNVSPGDRVEWKNELNPKLRQQGEVIAADDGGLLVRQQFESPDGPRTIQTRLPWDTPGLAKLPDELALVPPADNLPAELTSDEARRLERCEAVIERGKQTFIEVGNALLTIRDQRLYRQTHGTFEDYCRERWDMARPTAYRMMAAAEVIGDVTQQLPKANLFTADAPVPPNQSQAAALASVPREKRGEVWQDLQETSDGPVTAAAIREKAAEVTGKAKPGQPKADPEQEGRTRDVIALANREAAKRGHNPGEWLPVREDMLQRATACRDCGAQGLIDTGRRGVAGTNVVGLASDLPLFRDECAPAPAAAEPAPAEPAPAEPAPETSAETSAETSVRETETSAPAAAAVPPPIEEAKPVPMVSCLLPEPEYDWLLDQGLSVGGAVQLVRRLHDVAGRLGTTPAALLDDAEDAARVKDEPAAGGETTGAAAAVASLWDEEESNDDAGETADEHDDAAAAAGV